MNDQIVTLKHSEPWEKASFVRCYQEEAMPFGSLLIVGSIRLIVLFNLWDLCELVSLLFMGKEYPQACREPRWAVFLFMLPGTLTVWLLRAR